jgi:hypothetical protein
MSALLHHPSTTRRAGSGNRFPAILLAIVFLALAGCGDRSPVLPDAGLERREPGNPLNLLPAGDVTPPATVNDLDVHAGPPGLVTLDWTAPGDDGTHGQAVQYDLRRSPVPITAQNFDLAIPVPGVGPPRPAGTVDSVTVGVTPDEVVHFALRTMDDAGNWSALSNVVTWNGCTIGCGSCRCSGHILHPGFWFDFDNVGNAPAAGGNRTITLTFRVRTLLTCDDSGDRTCTGDVAWGASSTWKKGDGSSGPPVGEPNGTTGEIAVEAPCRKTRDGMTGDLTYTATVADPTGSGQAQGTITLTIATFCGDAKTDERTVTIAVDTSKGGDRVNHDESDLDGDGGTGTQEKAWKTNERKWSSTDRTGAPDRDPKAVERERRRERERAEDKKK